jgi:hypothetical protein
MAPPTPFESLATSKTLLAVLAVFLVITAKVWVLVTLSEIENKAHMLSLSMLVSHARPGTFQGHGTHASPTFA